MICWLDLETTGLEPKTGSILEIAMVVTGDDLVAVDSFQSAVRPIHMRGLEVMDDYVRRMHRKSGLLSEIWDYDVRYDPNGTGPGSALLREGISRCGEVESAAIGWVLSNRLWPAELPMEERRVMLRATPLGGNSVHFDRAWIKEHMPDLERLFSHRNVDCSTLNELAKRWAPLVHAARPGADGDPKHRAMDDVLGSIQLADWYRSELFLTTDEAFEVSRALISEASER